MKFYIDDEDTSTLRDSGINFPEDDYSEEESASDDLGIDLPADDEDTSTLRDLGISL